MLKRTLLIASVLLSMSVLGGCAMDASEEEALAGLEAEASIALDEGGVANAGDRMLDEADEGAAAGGMNTAATPVKWGIDVSYAQGYINWAQVKAAGVQFAIIRGGYGDNYTSQDDTQYANNVAGATANGIPYAVYLYSYATHSTGTASIASEIEHMKRLVSGKKPFAVYLDMEDPSTQYLGKTTLTNFAIQFADAMKAAGYKPGIYANTNWFTNYLDGPKLYSRGYSLWVADYRGYCGYTGSAYDMWQYTSSGKVSGISNYVDLNYMYKDITKGTTTTPPPSTSTIHVTYQTYDDVKKAWLPNVTDTTDYAGIYGHDVDCVYANLSSGSITYKVHYLGGSWLPAVTDRTDYAGMYNYPIDGLMMTTNTGKTIHYRVHLRKTGQWLPYVTGYNSADSNNGYAGIIGQPIDAIQVYVN